MTDNLTGFLQENILTLITFDTESCKLINSVLDAGLFENDFYKNIAKKSYEYFRIFKEAPKEHLADLLEEELNNDKVNQLYTKIISNLYESKDSINKKYVLHKLTDFIEEQNLKSSVIESASLIKAGNIEEAKSLLQKASKSSLTIFDPGTNFTNTKKSFGFLDSDLDPFPTGVTAFDAIRVGPVRGELLTIVAPPNRGKTSLMTLMGSTLVRSGYRVCHLSLEMSEEKMSRKYYQAFFSLSTTKQEAIFTKIQQDEHGFFAGLSFEHVNRPLIRNDTENVRQFLEKKLKPFMKRWDNKFFIKRFATGSLSIKGLEAYLDGMEQFYGFIPDVLIVDYADLLQMNKSNLRIEIGALYIELRRIAVERNIAVVTASQASKTALDSKIVEMQHLSEDFSKAMTSDTMFAYCQTKEEARLGLARLALMKARDEERDQMVVISQSYRMGQACISSALMNKGDYWEDIEKYIKQQSTIQRKK